METKKGRGRPKTGKVLFKKWVGAALHAKLTDLVAGEEWKPVVVAPGMPPVVVPDSKAAALEAEVDRLNADNYRLVTENVALAAKVAELEAAVQTRLEAADELTPNLRAKLAKAEARVRELERTGEG